MSAACSRASLGWSFTALYLELRRERATFLGP